MNIYLCPSPELYSLYHREGASVIITDIFRASTTMSTAFAEGASAILAVATVEECEELGRREHREGSLRLLGGILTAGGEEEHDCR